MNVWKSARQGVFLLASIALLTGCGTTLPSAPVVITTIREVAQPIPEGLLGCQIEPGTPVIRTDESVANYINDLAYAGRDCRSKLDEVRNLVVRTPLD